jgi:hypothetical protein
MMRQKNYKTSTKVQNNKGPLSRTYSGSKLLTQSRKFKESMNDDILRVFREDEENMRKMTGSRADSRNEVNKEFWSNDASKPLFDDDSLYRKLDKDRK